MPLPDPNRQPEFYAGVLPKRFLAWIIDSMAIVAVSVIIVVMTGFLGLFIWPLLYLTIGFVYRLFTLSNLSATPGMIFTGIEIRAADGRKIDKPEAFWHTSIYTIGLFVPFVQLASVILMAASPRGQGLSDMFVNTTALNRRVTM